MGTQPLASAEVYDPARGEFTATGSMTMPRELHAAARLADGRVLVAGGFDGNATLASAEVYDPPTGTFAAAASMTAPRDWQVATPLAGGRILFTGGNDGAGNVLNNAELYEP
jgi:hypothetical protein